MHMLSPQLFIIPHRSKHRTTVHSQQVRCQRSKDRAKELWGAGTTVSFSSTLLMTLTLVLTILASSLLIYGLAAEWSSTFTNTLLFLWVQRLLATSFFAYCISSSLIYQVCRFVFSLRVRRHRPMTFQQLIRKPQHRAVTAPRVVVLVPSYKEEFDVVRRTLLSAAFQACPNRSIVLLLDDPPAAGKEEDRINLERCRKLPREIHDLLSQPLARIEAKGQFIVAQSRSSDQSRIKEGLHELATLWFDAADWFESFAKGYDRKNHENALFCDQVLLARATDLRAYGQSLLCQTKSHVDFAEEYGRLLDIFTVGITAFERKTFANVSHEPNKAMNLNVYFDLISKSYDIVNSNGLKLLKIRSDDSGQYREQDAEYAIILDADSIITPNYALHLLEIMERPEHNRVAIAQTPYASIPDAPGYLERIAGAQTDSMFWSHQGMTTMNAASWVGASALVRIAAMREIVEISSENGHLVSRYVKTKTVTEDADTSLDLLLHNWTVYNYPQRMCYSATPADFGAFVIQRCRWATGGLLIVPKLMLYFWQAPSWRRFFEVLLRMHYLLSGNVGAILILSMVLFPWKSSPVQPAFLIWASVLAILSLFIETRQLGRKLLDAIGLYALGILLIPINISGLYQSLKQMITGKRGAFGRTPKMAHRTTAPWHHVALQWGISAMLAVKVVFYIWKVPILSVSIATAVSFLLTFHGVTRFIGWRNSYVDILAGLSRAVRRGD